MAEERAELRRGPGAADWLVAMCSTLLIAMEIQTQGARQLLQSAAVYYFDEPWIVQIHAAAIALDCAIVALCAAWFVTRFKKVTEAGMVALACVGLALCWAELVYALRLQEGAVYVLRDLPVRPVNNVGVVGAQVFGSYLLLKSPIVRLSGWREWLVKGGLAAAFWFFQAIVWQAIVPR